MLFKVEIVKLIDVFYVFHVSSVTAAVDAASQLSPFAGNTLDFSFLRVSTIVIL